MSERIFEVVKFNLLQQQVCTDAPTPEEAVELANRLAPSGTEHGWSLDEKCTPQPANCQRHPGRLHWMLIC